MTVRESGFTGDEQTDSLCVFTRTESLSVTPTKPLVCFYQWPAVFRLRWDPLWRWEAGSVQGNAQFIIIWEFDFALFFSSPYIPKQKNRTKSEHCCIFVNHFVPFISAAAKTKRQIQTDTDRYRQIEMQMVFTGQKERRKSWILLLLLIQAQSWAGLTGAESAGFHSAAASC